MMHLGEIMVNCCNVVLFGIVKILFGLCFHCYL